MTKFSVEHVSDHVARQNESHDRLLALMLEALKGLKYGEVTFIVQDGVVIQVNRIEKKRVPRLAH